MVKPIIFKIKDIVEMARQRIAMRKDVVIFWTGARGSGKSTGCWKFCKRVGSFEVDHLGVIHKVHRFVPKRDMIYTRDDALNFMMNRKYSVQMIDELISIAYNREFAQADQQGFIKAMNQYRSHFNIISACMPFFFDLDPDLRNLCWMRIEVIKRGRAVVHTPNESQYSNDPWDTEHNKKVERKWHMKDGTYKPRYWQLSTFRGYLVYDALKPLEEQFYESIRDEKRNLANKHLTNQIPEKTKSIYDNIIKMALEGKLDQAILESLCTINNLNYIKVRQYINKKLKDEGMKKTLKDLIKKEKKNEEENSYENILDK